MKKIKEIFVVIFSRNNQINFSVKRIENGYLLENRFYTDKRDIVKEFERLLNIIK